MESPASPPDMFLTNATKPPQSTKKKLFDCELLEEMEAKRQRTEESDSVLFSETLEEIPQYLRDELERVGFGETFEDIIDAFKTYEFTLEFMKKRSSERYITYTECRRRLGVLLRESAQYQEDAHNSLMEKQELERRCSEMQKEYIDMCSVFNDTTNGFMPKHGTCTICMDTKPIHYICTETCGAAFCDECLRHTCQKPCVEDMTCPSGTCPARFFLCEDAQFASEHAKALFASLKLFQESIRREYREAEGSNGAENTRLKALANDPLELVISNMKIDSLLSHECATCGVSVGLQDGCMKTVCENCKTPTCMYCGHQPEKDPSLSSSDLVERCYQHVYKCPFNPIRAMPGNEDNPYCPPCLYEDAIARADAHKIVNAFFGFMETYQDVYAPGFFVDVWREIRQRYSDCKAFEWIIVRIADRTFDYTGSVPRHTKKGYPAFRILGATVLKMQKPYRMMRDVRSEDPEAMCAKEYGMLRTTCEDVYILTECENYD